MTEKRSFWMISFCALVILGSSGCVTQRTVTKGGQVVSKKYVIHRPIRDAIQN